MQGYILNINKVKDEDLIVTILTKTKVYTTYRFYGARHSIINIGFKIDFELETTKNDIKRLKDILQLGYPWILDRNKLYLWQQYLKLFYKHLKDVDEIDNFYFDLLDDLAHRLTRQNPKRAIIENYIKLCKYEGRLEDHFICILCELPIKKNITLIRGFKPTHIKCSYGKNIELRKIEKLFFENNSIGLDNSECEYLWGILMQGL